MLIRAIAAEVPKPKLIQKSIELTNAVLTVFMPGCHWTRTSERCSTGFRIRVVRIALKEPMTAQKGSTMPSRMIPGSMTMPVGVAGSRTSLMVVVSRNGWGMRKTGLSRNMPVIAGTPTWIRPKEMPISEPSEKMRHLETTFRPPSSTCCSSLSISSFFLVESASASAPWALIGASGKGRRSTSEQSRKKK